MYIDNYINDNLYNSIIVILWLTIIFISIYYYFNLHNKTVFYDNVFNSLEFKDESTSTLSF